MRRLAVLIALALLGVVGSAAKATAIISSAIGGITVTDAGTATYTTAPALLGTDVTLSLLSGDAPIVQGGTENVGGTIITTTSSLTTNTNLSSYTNNGTIGWNPYAPQDGNILDTSNSDIWLSLGGQSGSGFAVFTFATPASALSFVWGSPSATNTVQLYGANGLIGIVSADGSNDLAVNGITAISNASSLVNSYVEGSLVTIAAAQAITEAVFSTSTAGFEIGAVSATPIPTPGTLTMLLGALLGLAALNKVGVRSRR